MTIDSHSNVVMDVARRTGLAPSFGLPSVADVAQATVGIHAARTVSPHPIALSRLRASDDVDALRLRPLESGVVRIRCMRKTLHYLPLEFAPVAHGATVRYRMRDAVTLASKLMEPASLKQAEELLLSELWDSWVAQADLERFFRQNDAFSVQAWRAALKCLWECGLVVCHNAAPFWCQERREYRATEAYFGSDLFNALSEAEAEHLLVSAYIDSYAPATLRDIMWWSGLSGQRVSSALSRVKDLLEVSVPWTPASVFVRRDQLDHLRSAPSTPDWIRLVGHEEVTFKAYFETRSRFVSESNYARLFNQIGEARPAVVMNGVACGVWEWTGSGVVVNLFEALSSDAESLLVEEILALNSALQARDERPINSDQLSLWAV